MESRKSFIKKLISPHNWRSLFGLIRTSYQPIIVGMAMYIPRYSNYPKNISLYSPIGLLNLMLRTPEDMKTINEVFFRQDYPCEITDRIFVDFGGNIGISSTYFLSRHQDSISYVYEPVPFNIEYAKKNLDVFGGRVRLIEKAVALNDGKVEFGIEESGRYCGIGLKNAKTIEVDCCEANRQLSEIISEHGRIDLLKIDIEGMEIPILKNLPRSLLCYIGRIVAECDGSKLHLPGFDCQQYLSVAYFTQRIVTARHSR